MFGRIGQMVLPSDDVRNSHFQVVDHVDEMKNPGTVGAPNGHVRIHAAVKFDAATHQVIDNDRFAQ